MQTRARPTRLGGEEVMAIYYVSNENGDWWTIDTATAQGDTLFIIKEEDLARAVADENPDEKEIDIDSIDKLEDVIRDYGTAQTVEVM
jgi:hypothetical protein